MGILAKLFNLTNISTYYETRPNLKIVYMVCSPETYHYFLKEGKLDSKRRTFFATFKDAKQFAEERPDRKFYLLRLFLFDSVVSAGPLVESNEAIEYDESVVGVYELN